MDRTFGRQVKDIHPAIRARCDKFMARISHRQKRLHEGRVVNIERPHGCLGDVLRQGPQMDTVVIPSCGKHTRLHHSLYDADAASLALINSSVKQELSQGLGIDVSGWAKPK